MPNITVFWRIRAHHCTRFEQSVEVVKFLLALNEGRLSLLLLFGVDKASEDSKYKFNDDLSWNQCEINIFLRSEGNKPYFAVWWVFQNSCWFDMIRTAIASHLAEGKIVKLSEIHIKQMRRSVAERKGLELVVETSHTRRQAPKVYI